MSSSVADLSIGGAVADIGDKMPSDHDHVTMGMLKSPKIIAVELMAFVISRSSANAALNLLGGQYKVIRSNPDTLTAIDSMLT